MKTMMIWMLVGGGIRLASPEVPGPADGVDEVREDWDPACLLAVGELRGIDDPHAFEEAALRWLEGHEERIAREIAAARGRRMIGWHHEEADDTPYGTTVVRLGERVRHSEPEAARAGSLK